MFQKKKLKKWRQENIRYHQCKLDEKEGIDVYSDPNLSVDDNEDAKKDEQFWQLPPSTGVVIKD